MSSQSGSDRPYSEPQSPPVPPVPPHLSAPPGAPVPHQPRWAWWVVGIAVPLVGVLVTVLASRPGGGPTATPGGPAGPASSANTQVASNDRPPPSATRSAEASPAPPARVFFGPKEVVVDPADSSWSTGNIVLDSAPPFGTTGPGSDVSIEWATGTPPSATGVPARRSPRGPVTARTPMRASAPSRSASTAPTTAARCRKAPASASRPGKDEPPSSASRSARSAVPPPPPDHRMGPAPGLSRPAGTVPARRSLRWTTGGAW